ncbi:hypothetical protein FLW53_32490 [Microbispora sp. SCL1-1]|uniref:hypothetical protein n=1 Tax=unclassified Microbispora TaxID=2614687 RepID=UPI00115734D6|nr:MULTISPECIES: hypothetical protein [unclassified Microbispora]NJP28842.1 hypothetical protein [Microbispora sp. CL1-1]TQS07054.1 hypothetical protein FLW53_32490 [Microbispora sp. SCL1-1]
MRKIALGLLACASVVAALAPAGPAAEATRTPGRETPRHQEAGPQEPRPRESRPREPRPQASGQRSTRAVRDAIEAGLTASSTTTNRGTQQIMINVATGGTGIQNAMCRGNRACDIAQALGMPSAAPSPTPTPAAALRAGSRAKARGHGGSRRAGGR